MGPCTSSASRARAARSWLRLRLRCSWPPAAVTTVRAPSKPGRGQSTATATPAAAGSEEAGAAVTDYVKYVGGKAGAADSSKSPIVIGFVNQQGGANDVGPGATDGAKLAVDYVNKYAGGIDGHPLKLHTCFISTAEEQGQQCGQKMANDKAVPVVGVGAVAVGAQPLNASIAGEKPMVWGVSVNQVDTKNKNGYILFGDSFHILAPWGTFGRDVLKAKTAAVVYPQVPGIIEGANAMVKGLEQAAAWGCRAARRRGAARCGAARGVCGRARGRSARGRGWPARGAQGRRRWSSGRGSRCARSGRPRWWSLGPSRPGTRGPGRCGRDGASRRPCRAPSRSCRGNARPWLCPRHPPWPRRPCPRALLARSR